MNNKEKGALKFLFSLTDIIMVLNASFEHLVS